MQSCKPSEVLYRVLTESGVIQDGTIKSGIALSMNSNVVTKLAAITELHNQDRNHTGIINHWSS